MGARVARGEKKKPGRSRWNDTGFNGAHEIRMHVGCSRAGVLSNSVDESALTLDQRPSVYRLFTRPQVDATTGVASFRTAETVRA